MKDYAAAVRQGALRAGPVRRSRGRRSRPSGSFSAPAHGGNLLADPSPVRGPAQASALEQAVERLSLGGFIELEEDRLRLRPEGFFISNSLFTELMEAL